MAHQEEQLEYWTQHLKDSSPAQLLTDRPRPALPSANISSVPLLIDGVLYERLLAFSRVQETTPFVVLLTALRAAHYRSTGTDDAIIGALTVLRDDFPPKDGSGPRVDTQCIRITMNDTVTFESVVRQVQATTTAAYANDDLPFEQLLSVLQPEWKKGSRAPLAQLAFALYPGAEPEEIPVQGFTDKSASLEEMISSDAELRFCQGPNRLKGQLIFAADLFQLETMQSMVDVFQEVLRRGLEQPRTPVSLLPLTDGLGRLDSMGLLEIRRTDYPRDSSIVDVFSEQVVAYPNAIAVKDAVSHLTYAELDQKSNELAFWLRQKRMAPETLVGVLAPRSCETVVSFLGILKANLAYLPFDTSFPTARIEGILSAIPGEKVVLLGVSVRPPMLQLVDVQLVRISDTLGLHTEMECVQAASQPSARSLAYVIYTSGSTGKPKGVMVEHRGVVRLAKNNNYTTSLPENPRIAHVANLAFDASIWEIASALLNAGTLICVDNSTVLDVKMLEDMCTQNRIQAVTLSPPILKLILVAAPTMLCSLSALYVAGDRLDSQDAIKVQTLLKGYAYNLYGPSENTVGATVFRITETESFSNGTPIGLAINNSGAYVMDPQQKLVSMGVLGELVVTGDGLARGYTDPALDVDRFIEIMIGGKVTKAYRTGDRARWRPIDGLLEFFGRMDNQVKIRGHRIELAEVEDAILSDSRIHDAAIVIRSMDDQDLTMVAFVTARRDQGDAREKGISEERETEMRIRRRLQDALPTYMHPAQIVVLDKMPLNSSNKVDRKELSRRAQIAPRIKQSPASRLSPRNEVESALCEELATLLGSTVGISDNFFELGGHSLMAMKLAARVSRRTDSHVSVKDIFDHPVIVDLAITIQQGSTPYSCIASHQHVGPVQQSFAQGRLWFLDQLNLQASWYIIPLAVRLRGQLDTHALNSALQALVERHETLRTTFESQEGVGLQVVHANSSTDLKVIDLSSENPSVYLQALEREQTTPFDLQSEPGWRVSLLRLDEGDHILSIVMHHIISDGWSTDILRHELDQFYAAALRGENPLAQIRPLPVQYRDFSLWQRQEEQLAEHEKQLAYWTRQLADSSPAEIPTDFPRPTVLSGKAGLLRLSIDGSLYEGLQSFSRLRQTTPFVVLLTAFRITHFRLTGSEDAMIGAPMANRNRSELENMIGFFVNTQCIRITVREEDTFESLVRQVGTTTAHAHANQDVPFERVVSALLPGSRDASKNPLVQIDLAFHSQIGLDKIQLEGLRGEPIPRPATTRADIEFHVFQNLDSMECEVLFAADLFQLETMQSMVDVFQEVLRRGLEQPRTPIAVLPLTDGLGRLDSMGLLEIKRTDYPRDSSIVDVFSEQVVAYPNAIAVKDAVSHLTYAELDQKSNELAFWLRQKHMAPETLVGVLAPRSCETVVSFLGILRAGLAYLPLDTKVPVVRTQTILSSIVGHKLVLLGADIQVPDLKLLDLELVRIGDALGQYDQTGATDTSTKPSATSLAYVIFTSGSSGKPKGVKVEHRGVVRLVKSSLYLQNLPKAPRVAHSANLAFDTSVWEIYTALLNGGTLVCMDLITLLDTNAMELFFSQERIQVASIPPAILKLCLDIAPTMLSTLDVLLSGGDRFDPDNAKKAQALSRGCVYNAYGPTENTVDSVQHRLADNDLLTNGTPIGRAVHNSGAYVMDPQQKLVSMGVLGELVVTGDGLARGYTDPALDVDRFVEIMIGGKVTKAYRTGDRARWRPTDGLLEFFGRMDNQVKIRGHRIELAEVEDAILGDSRIYDAAVVLRYSESKEPEMVGFATSRDDETVQEKTDNQLDGWEDHFDSSVYVGVDSISKAAIGRDFHSWTSMYDGSEIDRAEMQEWLDDTMQTLIDGKEIGSVLEIGTGTGMILFNLPETLHNYVGLEPSKSAAAFVDKAIQSVPSLAKIAKVHLGSATDVHRIAKIVPDTIVLNSVVQYFPSPDYLIEVIGTLLRLPSVKRLFFGDIRSYAVNNEFLASRALHTLGQTATKANVRRKISELEEIEEELLIDPAFFTSLASRFPSRIEHVEILPKRMKAINELSSFRFAAVVYLRGEEEQAQPLRTIAPNAWIDFQSSQMDRQSLLHLLHSSSDVSTLAFSNIPNGNISAERHIVQSLYSVDDDLQGLLNDTTWMLAARQEAKGCAALSPWDLVQIGEQTGFSVELSWARQTSCHGALDVIFHQYQSLSRTARTLFQFPVESRSHSADTLTNNPLRRLQRREAEMRIRRRLQDVLPTYMHPAQIVVLDKMPLNSSNKVDRKELSRRAQIAPRIKQSPASRLSPRNEVESALCEELATLLGSTVGISDNFFELGGHSLMATKLAARVSRRMGLYVSVKDIFDHPIIADLSKAVGSRETGSDCWRTEHSRSQAVVPFQLLPSDDTKNSIRDNILAHIKKLHPSKVLDIYPATHTQQTYLNDPLTGRPRAPSFFFLDFPSDSNVDSIQQACEALVQHFDIFRTVFLRISGRFYQVVLDRLQVPVQIVTVGENVAEATVALADEDEQQPFQLGQSLLRISILRKPGSTIRVGFCISHALYDGLSLESVVQSLHVLAKGRPLAPAAKFVQYMSQMAGSRKGGYEYWRSILRNSSMTEIPNDPQQELSNEGIWYLAKPVKIAIPSKPKQAITQATLFTTACAQVLAQRFNLRDLVFGRDVSGRQSLEPNPEMIVGPCTNTVPVRLCIDEDTLDQNLLQEVQNQYLNSLQFETLGLDEIRENCTDWTESITQYGCCTAYHNFDIYPESCLEGQRIRLRDFRPGTFVDRSPIYGVEMEAYPSSDKGDLHVSVQSATHEHEPDKIYREAEKDLKVCSEVDESWDEFSTGENLPREGVNSEDEIDQTDDGADDEAEYTAGFVHIEEDGSADTTAKLNKDYEVLSSTKSEARQKEISWKDERQLILFRKNAMQVALEWEAEKNLKKGRKSTARVRNRETYREGRKEGANHDVKRRRLTYSKPNKNKRDQEPTKSGKN